MPKKKFNSDVQIQLGNHQICFKKAINTHFKASNFPQTTQLIIDNFKEILITAGGENVPPFIIENMVRFLLIIVSFS